MPVAGPAMSVGRATEEPLRRAAIGDAVLLFVSGMIAFVVALPSEYLGLEARFALFAEDMLRNGPTPFPTTYLGPYADYPSTTIVPIYWLARLVGQVTPLVAVLPTALVSAGILVVIYQIGALRSRLWGCFAGCLTLLTLAFVQASRAVSPDQYTTLVTAACFYIAYSGCELDRRRRLWLLPLLLVFGYACRGPIGLIVPGGVLGTFYLFQRKWKAFSLISVVVLALLVGCSAVLLAAAEHQGGEAFAERVWSMQAIGRVQGVGRGFYYYWTTGFVSYACVFPLAVVTLCGQWRRISDRRDPDARLLYALTVWAVVVLVGLSIPGEKKARYILPIVPPLALIAAHLFIGTERQRELAWPREGFLRLCAALPYVAGIACAGRGLVVLFTNAGQDLFFGRTIVCTALAAVIAVVSMDRVPRELQTRLRTMVVGAMSLCLINVSVVEPSTFLRERSEPFVQRIEALQAKRDRPIVFYRIGPDQGDIVLAANYRKRLTPLFAETASGLWRCGVGAYVIAREGDLEGLSSTLPVRPKVVGRGSLAGDPCAVFTIGPDD